MASDLLAQARLLASKEPRKPLQASLRRAVSTAYYALFHFLGEESAKLVLGGAPQSKSFRDLARRAIAHTKVKDVCSEFVKPTPKDLLKSFWDKSVAHDPHQLVGDPDLLIISTAFRSLQEARHTADYDFSATFTRQEALEACEKAREAMHAWNALKSSKPEGLKLFAIAIMLWSGLSGR